MPELLQVDGTTQVGNWSGSPETLDLHLNVDEGVAGHDGDTSHNAATQDGSQILSCANPTLPGPFDKITLRVAAKKTEAGGSTIDVWMQPRINGSGLGEVKLTLGASYGDESIDWTGSWNQGQIDTLEVEFRADATGMNAEARVTAVDPTVTEAATASLRTQPRRGGRRPRPRGLRAGRIVHLSVHHTGLAAQPKPRIALPLVARARERPRAARTGRLIQFGLRHTGQQIAPPGTAGKLQPTQIVTRERTRPRPAGRIVQLPVPHTGQSAPPPATHLVPRLLVLRPVRQVRMRRHRQRGRVLQLRIWHTAQVRRRLLDRAITAGLHRGLARGVC